MLLVLLFLAVMFGASAFGQTKPTPAPTPAVPGPVTHTHKHKHTHYHGDDCDCHACANDCCSTCRKAPCCCPVSYPPEPTFTGEVEGFTTSASVQCRSSFSTVMGGSRVTATGLESVRNAQLLHEHALNTRSQDYQRSLCTAQALGTPPKVEVRTVTKTVVLTVPAPPVALVPHYTVLEPTVIRDVIGRRWCYRTPGGWYLY